MGMGAYESMKARGIRPVVTDIVIIDEAIMTYIKAISLIRLNGCIELFSYSGRDQSRVWYGLPG